MIKRHTPHSSVSKPPTGSETSHDGMQTQKDLADLTHWDKHLQTNKRPHARVHRSTNIPENLHPWHAPTKDPSHADNYSDKHITDLKSCGLHVQTSVTSHSGTYTHKHYQRSPPSDEYTTKRSETSQGGDIVAETMQTRHSRTYSHKQHRQDTWEL